MSFIQSIDWMQILKCFVVGGVICIIGQILLDKTKLTPAKILVIFVTISSYMLIKLASFAGFANTMPVYIFNSTIPLFSLLIFIYFFIFSLIKIIKNKCQITA